jgi:hypothetical protein
MTSLLSVLEIVDCKIKQLGDCEHYDNEPGFTERWYLHSLEEIKRQVIFELSKKKTGGELKINQIKAKQA